MGCRKNVKRLTVAERQAFTNAVNQLRADGTFDAYVDQHQGAHGHGHNGPAFFPWHREYLRRFEQDLQAIDPSVNLPYWDWTQDNLNAAGTESLIWRDDCMGGPGQAGSGAVTDGPFAGWGLIRNAFDIFTFPGTGGTVATHLDHPNYTEFRKIESPHGAAHMWVGGFMGNVANAPRDPAFWLLHCNVDRLWSEWIQKHSGTPGFEEFLPLSGGPQGHNLPDTMWPWNGTTSPVGHLPWTVAPENVSPADLIDHRALGYHYDTIDPECRRVPKPPIKERKDRLPKEVGPKEFKERLPKELGPKEPSSKELGPKEFAPKELGPKEVKEVREVPGGDPFIRPELRPDLTGAALANEPDLDPDVAALRDALRRRRTDLGGQG